MEAPATTPGQRTPAATAPAPSDPPPPGSGPEENVQLGSELSDVPVNSPVPAGANHLDGDEPQHPVGEVAVAIPEDPPAVEDPVVETVDGDLVRAPAARQLCKKNKSLNPSFILKPRLPRFHLAFAVPSDFPAAVRGMSGCSFGWSMEGLDPT